VEETRVQRFFIEIYAVVGSPDGDGSRGMPAHHHALHNRLSSVIEFCHFVFLSALVPIELSSCRQRRARKRGFSGETPRPARTAGPCTPMPLANSPWYGIWGPPPGAAAPGPR